MSTIIKANGSKWAGQEPDGIEKLIEVLSEHVIEERFFETWIDGSGEDKVKRNFCPITKTENGKTRFFGNFEELSHVFDIETDDKELIEKLTKAVKSNSGWIKFYYKNLIINLEDYRESARAAHNWTSFDPSKRGDQMINQYTDLLNYDVSKLIGATSDEIEYYISRFRGKFSLWISSKSRCASSMITGPANFPVEKNRRAMDLEHRRGIELDEFREKTIKRTLKAIDNRRPQEEKDNEIWDKLEKNIRLNAKTINNYDAGIDRKYTRALFVNGIVKPIETHAKNGNVELVKKALELITEINEASDKHIITKNHKVWKMADMAQQSLDKDKELKERKDEVIKYDGFKVIVCYADERIRIVHDKKPERSVIDEIKSNGFKWSRYNNAWQRKITNNAMYVTFKLLLKDKKRIG